MREFHRDSKGRVGMGFEHWEAEANANEGYETWKGSSLLQPHEQDIIRLTMGSMRYIVHSLRAKQYGEQFALHYYRSVVLTFSRTDDNYVFRQMIDDAIVEDAIIGGERQVHAINLTVGPDFMRCVPGAADIEIKRLNPSRIG